MILHLFSVVFAGVLCFNLYCFNVYRRREINETMSSLKMVFLRKRKSFMFLINRQIDEQFDQNMG